jgi:hypothetical protein
MYQTNSTETPLRVAASEEEKVEAGRKMRERSPEGVALLESLEESSWLQILWSTGPVP